MGLVNVAVIEASLSKDARHAFMLALGGSIPEIPYTLIAIYGASYLAELEEYKASLAIGVGVILLGLGIYFLFKRVPSQSISDQSVETRHAGYFGRGLILALLNPQLIFFWSGILILLETGSINFGSNPQLIDFNAAGWISPRLSFAFGAAFGALLILCIYILLAIKFRDKISEKLNHRINKLVGVFFVALGLYSIIKNVI